MNIYEEAIKKWGIAAQILMAIEELNELSVALCHHIRERTGLTMENIVDEIADVEIMIEQLKVMFDLTNRVGERKVLKLERLKERLK